MTDHAELNSLVVDHLPDLEAATRQIEAVVTPMVQDEVLRIVAAFLDEHEDWAGEAEDLTALWLAPRAWHDGEGGDDEYLVYFKLRTSAPRDAAADKFWLSAATGAGSGKLGLYLVSDRLGEARLGKLFAGEAELVEQLQGNGFICDIAAKRALYLPVSLDREQLAADLREDSIDTTMEPLARALAAAVASVPLLDSLVARIGVAVDGR